MKVHYIAMGNWPKGWTPTMPGDIVIQAYGSVLNQLVRIHPGCISNDHPPRYTVDKAKNEVMLEFLMEARDVDHVNEIKNSFESMLAGNGLRYTSDWTSDSMRMKVDEAKARLVGVLKSTGFDLENPNLSIVWTAFKKFVTEPVECRDDGCFFGVGCNDYGKREPGCRFRFGRQMWLETDSKETLVIELICDPTQELIELLGVNLVNLHIWSYDFQQIEEFFYAFERLPFLQIGSAIKSWDCEISQKTYYNEVVTVDPEPLRSDNRVKSGDIELLWAASSVDYEDIADQMRAERLKIDALWNPPATKKWWQFWK